MTAKAAVSRAMLMRRADVLCSASLGMAATAPDRPHCPLHAHSTQHSTHGRQARARTAALLDEDAPLSQLCTCIVCRALRLGERRRREGWECCLVGIAHSDDCSRLLFPYLPLCSLLSVVTVVMATISERARAVDIQLVGTSAGAAAAAAGHLHTAGGQVAQGEQPL